VRTFSGKVLGGQTGSARGRRNGERGFQPLRERGRSLKSKKFKGDYGTDSEVSSYVGEKGGEG